MNIKQPMFMCLYFINIFIVSFLESASQVQILYLINIFYLIFNNFFFPLAIHLLVERNWVICLLIFLTLWVCLIIFAKCPLTCSSTTYTSCTQSRPKCLIRFQVWFFGSGGQAYGSVYFLLHHIRKHVISLYLFLWQ